MDLRCMLVVSLVAFAAIHQVQAVPEDDIYWDLLNEHYDVFYARMNDYLRATNLPRFDDVKGKEFLGPRRPAKKAEPLRWINVHVSIGDQEETTLKIAHDDLYLIGFTNRNGDRYKLKFDAETDFQGLPDFTVLQKITVNYRSLMAYTTHEEIVVPGYDRLPNVLLGKQCAMEAVRILSNYGPAIDDEVLKQVLVRFVVMISEGMRFTTIREVFSGERWEEVTHIELKQARYAVNWSSLSMMLYHWQQSNYNDSTWGKYFEGANGMLRSVRRAEINNPSEALAIIDFLLRPEQRG